MEKLFDCFPQELKQQVLEYRIAKNGTGKRRGIQSRTNKHETLKTELYAFERLKKLPLVTERNLLSALNHFFNVKGATPEEMVLAFEKVCSKAKECNVCTMGFIKQFEAWQSSASNISTGERKLCP